MLEGVDSVDWYANSGAYTQGGDMAWNIRALLSRDQNERHEAEAILFDDMTHQGSIYPATLAVTPFLIEILASQQSPNPYFILHLLETVIQSAEEGMGGEKSLKNGYIEGYLEAYKRVVEGYHAYRLYINHESAQVRIMAIKLLTLNRNHYVASRVLLKRQLKREKSALVKAIILQKLGGMFHYLSWDNWQTKAKEAYQNLIISHLAAEHERLVRYAAAISLDAQSSLNGIVRNQVMDVLFDTLKLPIDAQKFADFDLQGDEIETDFLFVIEKIVSFGIRTFGIRGFAKYLNDSTLSPLNVHYLGRELLDRHFERISKAATYKTPFWKWRRFGGDVEKELNRGSSQSTPPLYSVEQIQYEYPPTGSNYIPGRALRREQHQVIELLVNCDAFWQIKSNIFSFFYGLPDDRDELRKLL